MIIFFSDSRDVKGLIDSEEMTKKEETFFPGEEKETGSTSDIYRDTNCQVRLESVRP